MKLKNKWNNEPIKPLTKEERLAISKKNDIVEDYDFVRDEKGNLKIKKVGEHSMQEYINSFKDECGLQNMMKKIALGQQVNTIEGYYGDISEIPTDQLNTRELEKRLADAEATLAKLKADTEAATKEKETTTNE